MSYATNADVAQRMGQSLLVQLTDDAGTGAADEAIISEARGSAEAEIDSYLARRYAAPVEVEDEPQVAVLLRSVTLDLVEYRLHARRPPVPEEVVRKRASAVEWLAAVADGRVLLPAVAELPANTSNGPSAAVSGASRVWSREEAEEL